MEGENDGTVLFKGTFVIECTNVYNLGNMIFGSDAELKKSLFLLSIRWKYTIISKIEIIFNIYSIKLT